jgi:hypothetical protein
MYFAARKGYVEDVRELKNIGGNVNTPNKVCGTKKEECFKSGGETCVKHSSQK